MVAEPSVLFADEPTGNLDSARSGEVMELLCQLNRERHLTIAMVTHEPDMAAYAGRTIHFHDGLVHSDSNHHTHSAAGITPTESALAEAGRDA
jgi:putative ABC transport system ATP-binding protein